MTTATFPAIFDASLFVYESQDLSTPGVFDTLPALAQLLDTHGIKYAFTLPTGEQMDKNRHHVLTLAHLEADSLLVTLLFSLWLKTERQANDDRLAKCLVSSLTRNFPTKQLATA